MYLIVGHHIGVDIVSLSETKIKWGKATILTNEFLSTLFHSTQNNSVYANNIIGLAYFLVTITLTYIFTFTTFPAYVFTSKSITVRVL